MEHLKPVMRLPLAILKTKSQVMWLWLTVTSYQNKAFKKLSTKIQNSDFPNQPHYLSQILETQKIQLDFSLFSLLSLVTWKV